MDIFDQLDPPKQTVASRVQTPDRLLRTSDGPVDAIPWPDTHVPPPVPYDPHRHTNGRFAPGNNVNPKGRPVSFGHLIRHYTADGLELVAFAFGVMRGEVLHHQFHPKTGELVPFEASPATKVEVMKWLKDQGFGKEVARLDVTSNGETIGGSSNASEDCPDLSKLTTEEVRQYLQLRRKAQMAMPVVEGTATVIPLPNNPLASDLTDKETPDA